MQGSIQLQVPLPSESRRHTIVPSSAEDDPDVISLMVPTIALPQAKKQSSVSVSKKCGLFLTKDIFHLIQHIVYLSWKWDQNWEEGGGAAYP